MSRIPRICWSPLSSSFCFSPSNFWCFPSRLITMLVSKAQWFLLCCFSSNLNSLGSPFPPLVVHWTLVVSLLLIPCYFSNSIYFVDHHCFHLDTPTHSKGDTRSPVPTTPPPAQSRPFPTQPYCHGKGITLVQCRKEFNLGDEVLISPEEWKSNRKLSEYM